MREWQLLVGTAAVADPSFPVQLSVTREGEKKCVVFTE